MSRAWLNTAGRLGVTFSALLLSVMVFADPELPRPYPAAPRGDVVDDYHGTQVPDPYRWLEDIDSPATRAWVAAQGRLSAGYLAALPGRERIAQSLKKIWDYERWGTPQRFGASWFYTHNDGLQNQSVLWVTPDPVDPGRILLDPNTLSADGTISLQERSVSPDGRLLAYALSEAGSDWQVWHVREVATGKDLPDELHWSKFGGASWLHDGSGFYYTRYEQPRSDALKAANEYEKIFFHKLGTAQSADTLVYTRTDDPNWFLGTEVTEDGHYLVIFANHGDEVENTLAVRDLRQPGAPLKPIIPEPNAVYTFVGEVDDTLYVLTDREAPRYRLIAIDLKQPDPAHWRPVIPQAAQTLDSVTLVGHQLLAQYLKDAHSAITRFALDGKPLGAVHLEGLGTAGGFSGHLEDRFTYYGYSSLTTPPSVYRLDLSTGQSHLWKRPHLAGFNPQDYQTRQVFYPSKDGTRIPMFIVSRKGAARDGSHRTLLYGYGGFNISLQPGFSPAVAGWLQEGGVYAMANLRGGGEYGRPWHEAGMKTHKQNVFDDFAAAANYLIRTGWTRPSRLAIQGRSNGGLLVGATLEQHPDLFAACVAQVGVMDMLRFRDFTVGKGWESDYGSVDNPEEFKALLAYSPLQNVKSGVAYPPTLITTGDHDDRVFPAHSFKLAAALQHADPDGHPILLRIDARAGHGGGKPTAKLIDETADIYAFVLNAMK